MRLDRYLSLHNVNLTRSQAVWRIRHGWVTVNGQVCTKPGHIVALSDSISLQKGADFVSYAGYKLLQGIEHFSCDVAGAVALDAGLSTGGFADCLLQNGVERLYGVDIGVGQVSEKLKADSRLVVMEQTNLGAVQLPELVDLVTLDLSFVSVTYHLEHVTTLLSKSAQLLILIKPQFEVGKESISAQGIVRDKRARERACDRVALSCQRLQMKVHGIICVTPKESEGNQEYLLYATYRT